MNTYHTYDAGFYRDGHRHTKCDRCRCNPVVQIRDNREFDREGKRKGGEWARFVVHRSLVPKRKAFTHDIGGGFLHDCNTPDVLAVFDLNSARFAGGYSIDAKGYTAGPA